MVICTLVFWAFCSTLIAQPSKSSIKDKQKLQGQLDLSAYPLHKASLLGLTSTDHPTWGLGFSGAAGRWSFYGISFHEISPAKVFLSQFETNISYSLVEFRPVKCTLFNTAISAAKDAAIYMIPTISLAWGKSRRLKTDLTPYTWSLYSDIAGFTYTLSYEWHHRMAKNRSFGFQTKAVYTKIRPQYDGGIGEFSPFFSFKNFKLQGRMIYQFASQKFIYDVSARAAFKFY